MSAWIIQDGNYPDFAVGDRVEFALEFALQGPLQHLDGSPIRAVAVGDDEYDVVGRVAHIGRGSWVLDFGLLAYEESPPPAELQLGMTVAARVSLGVDPFAYFERLSKDNSHPAMVYTWTIRSIRQETAPFELSGAMPVRDEFKRHWIELVRTNAWVDDGGHGEYVLECDLEEVPPARFSATAN